MLVVLCIIAFIMYIKFKCTDDFYINEIGSTFSIGVFSILSIITILKYII